jgi:hypothetical protein
MTNGIMTNGIMTKGRGKDGGVFVATTSGKTSPARHSEHVADDLPVNPRSAVGPENR